MNKKIKKPNRNLESIQDDLIETVCHNFQNVVSALV